MSYNWQLSDWKKFSYDIGCLDKYVHNFSEKIGVSKGSLEILSKKYKNKNLIEILVTEAMKTSEIEGEYLSRKDVMSSIKTNLGLSIKQECKDVQAKGMATLVTKIHSDYTSSLSEEMLFDWHKMIFPSKSKVAVACWRTHSEPMQVVSGSYGKEEIHFEAPPSKIVPKEIKTFIKWFNDTAPGGKKELLFAPVRSAIAHLYFESIHPFEDGNGRVGRAIAEKALLQTVGFPLLISLSTVIEAERMKYYQALKVGQGTNEVTQWVVYFTEVILQALDNSAVLIKFTVQKTRLFDTYKNQINTRQTKVLKRMLQEVSGFEGGMTAKKYMRITKTSKPTATRDMQKLRELGIFKPFGEGRSTSYQVEFVE